MQLYTPQCTKSQELGLQIQNGAHAAKQNRGLGYSGASPAERETICVGSITKQLTEEYVLAMSQTHR